VFEQIGFFEGAGFAAALALGGILLTSWAKVKDFFSRLYSRIVVTVIIDWPVYTAVQAYLNRNYKRSRFGIKFYEGFHAFVRPKRRWEMVAYERIGKSSRLFRRGWCFLWAKYGNDDNNSRDTLAVSFFRGMLNPEKLVADAVTYWNDVTRGTGGNRSTRYCVYRVFGKGGRLRGVASSDDSDSDSAGAGAVRVQSARASFMDEIYEHNLIGWEPDDIGPDVTIGSAVEKMALHEDALEAVEEVKRWLESEKWYIERSIPWKRGWLLHGVPGTGKTSLVRSIAEDLDIPIYVYDLASLSNQEMTESWMTMLEHTPVIALLEDIDNVFYERKNTTGEMGGGLTFDCLLNCIDGVERSDGLFVVVTTNRLEGLDKALGIPSDDGSGVSTRPGRIDRAIAMLPLSEDGRRKLAKRILRDWPEKIEELVASCEGNTGAEFQERCARWALAKHWDDKEDDEARSVLEHEHARC